MGLFLQTERFLDGLFKPKGGKMDNLEITSKIVMFISLFLAYCAVNTIKPAEEDILGMKFTGPDHHLWRFRVGFFQVVGAVAFYAWANYHAHATLETSWVMREDIYTTVVIVCAASLITGIVNVISGSDTQRLGHL
ncbi:MAG: hypothetical protein ABH835_00225 [Patescibacteria group bacterium]